MSRSFLFGGFLFGALALFPCVVHATDADGDGMDDAWESSMGLSSSDPLDAFTDKDGDRVPNLWEHDRLTLANDAGDAPPFDATVDSTQPADPNAPTYRFQTLETAYRSIATRFPSTYRAVVKVCRGSHDAVLTATDVNNNPAPRKIAWLGELGGQRASGYEGAILVGGGNHGLLLTDETVLDGLIFDPLDWNQPSFSQPAISVIPSSSGVTEVRVVNCLVRNWRTWSDIMAGDALGGALFNDGGDVWLVHTTFCNSSAVDLDTSSFLGLVENASGTLHVINSVVWEAHSAAATDAIVGVAASTVQTSVIQEGPSGTAIHTDPALTAAGYLTAGSPCIGAVTSVTLPHDLNNEARPASSGDIGADEWLNTDSDTLPDWWEMFWFGNLSQGDSGDPNANFYTNIEEYEDGMPPTDDQDGDGLNDEWERLYFNDITAQDGSGNPDGDGRTNIQEQAAFTDPTQIDWDWDNDSDGLPYGWEMEHFGNTTSQDGNGNADLPQPDIANNLQEYLAGTDPLVYDVDWDADGMDDVDEWAWFGTYAQTLLTDFDGDGLANGWEIDHGTNPANADSNHDGISDGSANNLGISMTENDVDGDGLDNATEIAIGTNPHNSDSDGDGVADGSDAFPSDPSVWNAPANVAGPPVITPLSPPGVVVVP